MSASCQATVSTNSPLIPTEQYLATESCSFWEHDPMSQKRKVYPNQGLIAHLCELPTFNINVSPMTFFLSLITELSLLFAHEFKA